MTEKPLVSVIVPVFNLRDYLSRAVESVLAQTCPDVELILADDGSFDGSREIVAGCQHSHPETVRALYLSHRGASAARNAGIEAARGEWIAFLDGDDAWFPDKIEKQLLAARAAPGYDFIACPATLLGTDRLMHPNPPRDGDLHLNLLRHGCFFTLSSVLLHRGRLGETRFDEELPGAQDLDLFLRLAPGAAFLLLDEPLLGYRVRAGAISDPGGSRFLQLHAHYRIARREIRRLRCPDPALHRLLRRELSGMLRGISHEAAWAALQSRQSSLGQRLRLAFLATVQAPWKPKNWRFLVQSVLPGGWSRWLAARRGELRQPRCQRPRPRR